MFIGEREIEKTSVEDGYIRIRFKDSKITEVFHKDVFTKMKTKDIRKLSHIEYQMEKQDLVLQDLFKVFKKYHVLIEDTGFIFERVKMSYSDRINRFLASLYYKELQGNEDPQMVLDKVSVNMFEEKTKN